MARFAPLPASPVAAGGGPAFGAYEGAWPEIDLSRWAGAGLAGAWRRLSRRKAWHYAFVGTDDVIVGLAVVDVGYAANGFVFVADRAAGAVIADHGVLVAPRLTRTVGAGTRDPAVLVRGATRLSIGGHGEGWRIEARVGDALALDAKLGDGTPLTLVAPVRHGIVNTTIKHGALPATGTLTVGDRRFSLDGGRGGLDRTQGLLARETAWRWAFATGSDEKGAPVAFNLVEGFNDGDHTENAVWIDGRPEPLPRCRFVFDPARPEGRWSLASDDGRVDVAFEPAGAHREDRDLAIARSRFVQVAGAFTGLLTTTSGRVVYVSRLPGVTEDQAVRW